MEFFYKNGYAAEIWLIMLLMLSLLTSACTVQDNYDIDSARQIAVNAILENDKYTQSDAYGFNELAAENTSCNSCYHFVYAFNTSQEYYQEISGYFVEVDMKENNIINIKYTAISSEPFNQKESENTNVLLPIPDRFDKFCDNKCGDGYCNDIVCQSVGCPCAENKENCPEDC